MHLRQGLIWGGVTLTIALPLIAAAQSPLLAWRDPIYIAASFAGIIGLLMLLIQPMLITGTLLGVLGKKAHTWVGAGLVLAVVGHVAGLWITSPPDVIDVLLFRSPAPFSVWGALAMWAVFAAALLAIFRKRIGLRIWRVGHSSATVIVLVGTVVHAWLIDGTIGTALKTLVCLLLLAAYVAAIWRRKVWRIFR